MAQLVGLLLSVVLVAGGIERHLSGQEPNPPAPPQGAPVQGAPVQGAPVQGQGQDPKPQITPPGIPARLDPQNPVAPIPVDFEAEQRGAPIREMTLRDALRLGRQNNLDLRAAELVPQQARQNLLVQEAAFQPELYGDVGYTDSQTPQRNPFSPAISRQTWDATLGWRQRVVTGGLFDLAYQPTRLTQSTNVVGFPDQQYASEWRVQYTQPLLRGAWTDYNLAGINSARYSLRQSEHAFERTLQDTLLAIVIAYWELVSARANYDVSIAGLAVAREQLRITEERIRVRELAPRDRVADEAELARRNEELIFTDNEIRRREDDLRRLLFDDQQGLLWRWNLRPTSPLDIEPPIQEIPFEPLAEVALARRPDLNALRSRIAAAEVDLVTFDRDILPGLDLVSTYGSNGVRDQFPDAWDDSINQQYPTWGLRLQFSVPIGNQAAHARRTQQALEVERLKRQLYSQMMEASKEVREAVRNLRSLAQSIQASGESVRLAVTNLETEQIKLRVGASTVFEVQRRNQDLIAARRRHLRNQLDYQVALSRLEYVQGILEVPRD